MTLQQRIRRGQSRHADDWLITYADTITLLLCLFVIVLTIKTGAKSATPECVAPTAETPAAQITAQDGIFLGQPAIRSFTPVTEAVTDQSSPAMLSPAADAPAVRNVADNPPAMDVAEPFSEALRTVNATTEAAVAPVQVIVPAPPEMVKPEPARSSLPDVVARLISRGTPIVAQSGDRITTLQIGSAAFFSSGSAALSNAGKAILGDVAGTLESPEFAAYHITIEGHTDDTPISTPQFQSNWELSAARAAAVVRFLLDLGVPAGKLTASGYADTVAIAPNRTADGTVIPDNQARNRRVVIRLEKIDKAK
jgi:chemotaxis protein MotB